MDAKKKRGLAFIAGPCCFRPFFTSPSPPSDREAFTCCSKTSDFRSPLHKGTFTQQFRDTLNVIVFECWGSFKLTRTPFRVGFLSHDFKIINDHEAKGWRLNALDPGSVNVPRECVFLVWEVWSLGICHGIYIYKKLWHDMTFSFTLWVWSNHHKNEDMQIGSFGVLLWWTNHTCTVSSSQNKNADRERTHDLLLISQYEHYKENNVLTYKICKNK